MPVSAYEGGDVNSFDESDFKVQGKDGKFSYFFRQSAHRTLTQQNQLFVNFFVCDEFAAFVTFNLLSANVYQGESMHYLLSTVATEFK